MKAIMKKPFFRAFYCLANLYLGGFLIADESVGHKTSVIDSKAAGAKIQPASVETTKPSLANLDWQSLFDGETLKGWKIIDFAGGGEISVQPVVSAKDKATNSASGKAIFVEPGDMLTGIKWRQAEIKLGEKP